MQTPLHRHHSHRYSNRISILLSFVLFLFSSTTFSQKSPEHVESPEGELAEVYVMRINLQRELRERLDEVLGRLAQPYNLYGTVRVSLRGEIYHTVKKKKRRGMDLKVGGSELVKLPGLPQMRGALPGSGNTKMSISIPQSSTSQVSRELVIRLEKLSVRIFIEKGLNPERLAKLKEVAVDIAGIDLTRGDSLEFIDIERRVEKDPGPPTMVIARELVLMACGALLLGTIIMAIAVGRRRRSSSSTTQLLGQLGGSDSTKEETGKSASDEEMDTDMEEQALDTRHKKAHSFAFMREVSEKDFIEVLSSVSPRTAAAMLDQVGLNSGMVRVLLDGSSSEYKNNLIEHLARVEQISVSDVQSMEAEARKVLDKVQSYRQFGHASLAAEILSKASIDDARTLLDHLRDREPELAASVRKELVLFEDIPSLPADTIRELIGALDPAVIAIALQNADDNIRKAIQNPLSKRKRAIIDSELDVIGDRSSDEIEEARLKMEETMRQLPKKKNKDISRETM